MKLFGRNITFSGGKVKVAKEQYKGKIDAVGVTRLGRKTFSLGEHSWLNRCEHYERLAQDYPLFNQACLSLAGMVMSQGIFFGAAEKKNEETYPLAEEALYRVDKLTDQLGTVTKMYESVYRMAKFGGCFWEVSFTPSFGFRVVPFLEHVEPHQYDGFGNVMSWRQVINGAPVAEWKVEPSQNDAYIIPLMWNVTKSTWPYGTSLGTGLETELEALINMETSAKDYMDKVAWPYEILALGNETSNVLDSEYSQAKTEWKNRVPGQGLVTRNMPVEIKPGGTGSTPIREIATLCELMKDNVHDGLSIPPISKLYNSTEASATVLTKHVMTCLGQPIQWMLKEVYEEYVLKPYLEYTGFSVKSCPHTLFESPDVHKEEEGAYYVSLVQNKIQTPMQACEHLGLEYDQDYWMLQEKKQQEQFAQQQQQKQQPFGGKQEANQEKPKDKDSDKEDKAEVDEWVVHKRKRTRAA